MSLAAIVMAAGRGTRMGSGTPKPLVRVAGRRMVDWVFDAARGAGASPVVVVASPAVGEALAGVGVDVAVQEEASGTGGAVAAARPALERFAGDVLVLAADVPLVTASTLGALVAEHRRAGAGVTLLSLESPEPLPYGRVVRDEGGALQAIVEEADATADERAIAELSSSIYVFRAGALWSAVACLDAGNAKGELQLSSAVRRVVESGLPGAVVRAADPVEGHGVNTPADLEVAASVLRRRPAPS